MAKTTEVTEVIPLEDGSSSDSIERPSPIETQNTFHGRESYSIYNTGRPPIPTTHHSKRYSYIETPNDSPPGTPIPGQGNSPYGHLIPPRYQSYVTIGDTRDSSPAAAPTPFVSNCYHRYMY